MGRRKTEPEKTQRLVVAETDSGRVLLETALDLPVHNVHLSPNGRSVVLDGGDGDRATIQLRDVRTGAIRFTRREPAFAFALPWISFSPDGKRLCVTAAPGFPGVPSGIRDHTAPLYIWDDDGNEVLRITVDGELSGPAVFSRDGHRLMAVRTGFERLPPEEMLEVIDATPLPGDEPQSLKR